MKKLLVCQHVPHEILGTLNPLLKQAGFRIRYVNFGRHPDAQPTLDGYDGLVVLGGPMSAYDDERLPHLKIEMKLIEAALQRNLPILGICLGAQLIARTLGARVFANHTKEIGWYNVHPTAHAGEDPLIGEFEAVEKIFQWHGDTFEIPAGSVHLASSMACANQAFRYAEKVYAFQFHLEVDEPMILRWLKVPENRREIQSLHGDIDPDQIHRETAHYIERLHELSEHVFGEFINLFGADTARRRMVPR
ncbi:MAG: amidotransferase [Deltaproteobacteria bacterium]|nr:amidotransferase [Deltaproteobacteria bacterium]MBM4299820.1 amidotransferase [Deltaproteobacteria bacterium]